MDLFDIVAARAGGSGGSGAPQVQADWKINDENSKAYIKNRPFTVKIIENIYDYEFTTTITNIPNLREFKEGETYEVHIEATQGTQNFVYDYPELEVTNLSFLTGVNSPGFLLAPSGTSEVPPESIGATTEDFLFVLINDTLATDTNTFTEVEGTCSIISMKNSFSSDEEHLISFIIKKIEKETNVDEAYISLLQPNWSEEDNNMAGYIQNKPFGEEVVFTQDWIPQDGLNIVETGETSGWSVAETGWKLNTANTSDWKITQVIFDKSNQNIVITEMSDVYTYSVADLLSIKNIDPDDYPGCDDWWVTGIGSSLDQIIIATGFSANKTFTDISSVELSTITAADNTFLLQAEDSAASVKFGIKNYNGLAKEIKKLDKKYVSVPLPPTTNTISSGSTSIPTAGAVYDAIFGLTEASY